MDSVLQDIRYAVRMLAKERGFALTAIATLALCLGANAAVFAVVNAVLLRPLPLPDADRILLLSNQYPKGRLGGNYSFAPDYIDRRRELTVFDEQAMFGSQDATLEVDGTAERLRVMSTTPTWFGVVRVNPILGRGFTDDDGQRGNEPKVVLSYGAWQQFFAGDAGVIGRDLMLGGRPHTVVGVMPRDFVFVDPRVRVWVPLVFSDEQLRTRHGGQPFRHIGRLAPGATTEQARAQLAALDAANLDRLPEFRTWMIENGYYTRVEPLQEMLVRDVRVNLYLLWASAGLVLLLGAANVTNLALARATRRQTELATRLALGAGHIRLVRLLVTENVIVAVAGGAVGLTLALWLIDALLWSGIERLPRVDEVRLDAVAAAFALAISVVAGAVVGLLSAGFALNPNLRHRLIANGRSSTGGPQARNVRHGLVVAQIALASVLLTGSGLLLASFQRVLAVNPGFTADGVLTAAVNLSDGRYPNDADKRAFMVRALETLRATSGFGAVGAAQSLPFDKQSTRRIAVPEGKRVQPGEVVGAPRWLPITSGYLEAMQIELVSGRRFDDRDDERAMRVAIVDERLARTFWPDRDPIGRRMYLPNDPDDLSTMADPTHFLTVVGVVREVRMDDLVGDRATLGTFYFPYVQGAVIRGATTMPPTMKFVVKSSLTTAATVRSIRAALATADPGLAVFDTRRMQEFTDLSLALRRGVLTMAMVFAVTALGLATIGLYGVLAYFVAARRREFGIRMALGGTLRDIVQLILREGGALSMAGLVIGLVASAGAGGLIRDQLYEVQPLDPRILAAVALTIATIAIVACTLPARRASRVNPAIVLAQE